MQMFRDVFRAVNSKLPVAEPGRGYGGQEAIPRHISCKKMIRGNAGLLLNGAGVLMTKGQREG